MNLDQLIEALKVLVPVAKAMPVAGTYLEGGFAAVLAMCEMAQGSRLLNEDLAALAERASELAATILEEVKEADPASFPHLTQRVEQFTVMTEEIQNSLNELLKKRQKQNRVARVLSWRQLKDEIQALSNKLDEGITRLNLRSGVRAGLLLKRLLNLGSELKAGQRRLEAGQNRLEAQVEAGFARLEARHTHLPQDATDSMILDTLDPELSACYNARRVPNDAQPTVRGSEDGCFPGTRAQLLQDVHHWIDTHQNGLFWLSGLAGTGKTTVALTIARHLDESKQLLGSFFILRDVKRRSSALSIVTTIAHQLADFNSDLHSRICTVLRTKRGLLQMSLWDQIDTLIREPLSHLSVEKPLVLVIDALDECEKDGHIEGGKLIPLLIRALPPMVKLFLTSRPEDTIQAMMRQLDPQLVKLHDIEASIVKGDIRLYLEYHLRALQTSDLSSLWPSDSELAELVERCGLLFVYAATLVRFLSVTLGFSRQKLLKSILDSPSVSVKDNPYEKLDKDVYTHIVHTAIFDGMRKNPQLAERFRLLVGTIVLVRDPVSLPALASLAVTDIDDVGAFLSRLSSVLVLPEDRNKEIRVFHLSFSDFIIARCSEKTLKIDPVIHHTRLARQCLVLMNGHLARDMCSIGDPSLLNTEVADLQDRIKSKIPGEVRYACCHWATHLALATKNPGLLEALSTFCNTKLVYWIEALSLLGELSTALPLLSSAQLWNQTTPAREDTYQQLLSDCERLMKEFYVPVKASALQVYHTALVFLPHCLLLEKASHEIPNSPRTISERHRGWNASQSHALGGHTGRVNSVAVSPDGESIVSGSDDKTLRVWDAHTGENTATLEGHTGWVWSVAFSPDGQQIVSGSEDRTLRVWDANTGENTTKIEGHTGSVYSVAFSPNGQQIVSGSEDGTLRVWDASTGENTAILKDHTGSVLSVAFSPNGQQIVSGSSDKTLRVWDASTGKNTATLKGHTGYVRSVAFSPNGQQIISGSGDNTLRVWDTSTGKSTATLKGHTNYVQSVTFSPNGQQIVSGSGDLTLRVWDASTGKNTATLKGHTGLVLSVAFSPNGQQIVSGSVDSTLRVWGASIIGDRSPRLGKYGQLRALASGFLPNSWSLMAGENKATLKGHTGSIRFVTISPKGDKIVSGSSASTLRVWNASTGKNIATLKGHTDWVRSAAFSPNGQQIVSGSDDSTLRVWDASTGKSTVTLKGHTIWVLSVAFSPNGQQIVSGSYSTLRVWDVNTGKNTATLSGHTDWVRSVAFSPNGQQIVSGSSDKTLRVWDVSTCENSATLEGHTDELRSVAFSPNGQQIVSGSDDKTLRVWDTSTGESTAILEGHTDPVLSVSFSPDGNQIISTDKVGETRTWSPQTTSPVMPPPIVPPATLVTSGQRYPAPLGYTVNCSTGWVFEILGDDLPPRRLFWLPPNRRPSNSEDTVVARWHERTLVTGSVDGVVSVIYCS